MMASVLSAACIEIAFLVFTISTSLPLLNMGVMTMKMMSMTSITSTMGVTLISATGGGALCFTISSTLTGIVSLFSYTCLRQFLYDWILVLAPESLAGSPVHSTRRVRVHR